MFIVPSFKMFTGVPHKIKQWFTGWDIYIFLLHSFEMFRMRPGVQLFYVVFGSNMFQLRLSMSCILWKHCCQRMTCTLTAQHAASGKFLEPCSQFLKMFLIKIALLNPLIFQWGFSEFQWDLTGCHEHGFWRLDSQGFWSKNQHIMTWEWYVHAWLWYHDNDDHMINYIEWYS